MILLSFDVGIKNLAYCLLSMNENEDTNTYENNNSKNFIEKIIDVLDKKTSYKNRKIIRNFAIKLFSPKKTIDSYLDIYNKIILK